MNPLRPIRILGTVLVLAGLLAPACSGDDDQAKTGDEDNIVPADAETLFDQAAVCDQTLKRHVSVRDKDLAEGTVRWNCADVKGVEGEHRGQEYCEYHAVANGKKAQRVADIDTSEPLYCYFTSVYFDVDGKSTPGKRDEELAAALSKPENLGAKVDADLVRMKNSVNSRNAATLLIEDCEKIAPDLNEERQVACYMASLKGSGEELRRICRGQDLTDEKRWEKAQALGAKVLAEGEAGFDEQRDIIGCLSLHRAEHGGATYRNSDPMICARIFRARQECQCSWSALPKELEGFFFTGWTADAMPPGCQAAVVDGKPYPHLTLCRVPEAEVEELELNLDYAEDLQKFCNDRFGKDLVMKAPLRAVEDPGSCKSETAFCEAFTDGGGSTGSGSGGAGGGGAGTGGDGTSGGSSGPTGSSGAGGAGGGAGVCAHDECAEGDALDPACSDCAKKVCDADPYCCSTAWDAQCIGQVEGACGESCP